MERVTVEDVPSWSYRGLELFMLVPMILSVLMGLGILVVGLLSLGSGATEAAAGAGTGAGAAGATGSDPGAGFTALLGGVAIVWLLAIFLGLLSILGIPLLLFLDAKKVADQDLDWEPEPVLYLILGFFVSGLAVLHYLYKRHEYVIDWVGSETWWHVALVGVGIGLVSIVGSVVNPLLMGLALIAFPLYTIGIYKDSIYVRLNSDWRPNPVNHFLIALFSTLLVVPGVFYFGYFAYKRHGAIGLV
ncbi:hypothetical protein [Halosimplex amylolyticum]|uniref:hypothetical protein n=1 Tax=Halosimplex amylolyticum TaxID=3396616 RepID=UPI003F570095